MTGRAIRDLRKGRVNLRIVLVMRVQALVGAFIGRVGAGKVLVALLIFLVWL